LTKAGVILENDPWIIGLAHVALLHNSSVGYSRQVYHERVLHMFQRTPEIRDEILGPLDPN